MDKTIIADSLSLGVYFMPRAYSSLSSRAVLDSMSLGIFKMPQRQTSAGASVVMDAMCVGVERPQHGYEDAVVARGQRYDFHYVFPYLAGAAIPI